MMITVANVIANEAQSLPPVCICTSTECSTIFDHSVQSIEAICFFVWELTDEYILSSPLTSAHAHHEESGHIRLD